MRVSIRSAGVLAVLGLTMMLGGVGCHKSDDFGSGAPDPASTSTTGQHSPPPMMRKAGVTQAGGGQSSTVNPQ